MVSSLATGNLQTSLWQSWTPCILTDASEFGQALTLKGKWKDEEGVQWIFILDQA